jgi:hypothetical protein
MIAGKAMDCTLVYLLLLITMREVRCSAHGIISHKACSFTLRLPTQCFLLSLRMVCGSIEKTRLLARTREFCTNPIEGAQGGIEDGVGIPFSLFHRERYQIAACCSRLTFRKCFRIEKLASEPYTAGG